MAPSSQPLDLVFATFFARSLLARSCVSVSIGTCRSRARFCCSQANQRFSTPVRYLGDADIAREFQVQNSTHEASTRAIGNTQSTLSLSQKHTCTTRTLSWIEDIEMHAPSRLARLLLWRLRSWLRFFSDGGSRSWFFRTVVCHRFRRVARARRGGCRFLRFRVAFADGSFRLLLLGRRAAMLLRIALVRVVRAIIGTVRGAGAAAAAAVRVSHGARLLNLLFEHAQRIAEQRAEHSRRELLAPRRQLVEPDRRVQADFARRLALSGSRCGVLVLAERECPRLVVNRRLLLARLLCLGLRRRTGRR